MTATTDDFWSCFDPTAMISARTLDPRKGAAPSSPPLVFLRPRDDEEQWPDPEDPVDPDDPCSVYVRAPLVAAQVRLDLGNVECPSESDLQRVVQAVRAQFAAVVPNADVRVRCVDRVLGIGVWNPGGASSACESAARDRALERLDLVAPGENFGFYLSASLLNERAQEAFAAAPKRLTGNGSPSSSGPIHLTGLRVEFVAPDTVLTRIDGYDDRPWPDVGFTLTITDRITKFAVLETTSDVDTHGAWVAVLAGLLLGAATLFVPVLLPLTLFVVWGDLDSALDNTSGAGQAGVGGRALGLVPVRVPLPGSRALVIGYISTEVTAAGMFFSGIASSQPRTATAGVNGPTRMVITETVGGASAVYGVHGDDTFGGLVVRWSAEPGVLIQSPTSARTKVTFLRGSHTASSAPFTRTLRAAVHDEDGFTADLALDVQLTVVEESETTPLCTARPWLPACQPAEV